MKSEKHIIIEEKDIKKENDYGKSDYITEF